MNIKNILETMIIILIKIKFLKDVSSLSFKSALIYDMDYIVKEIDSIETKELEEIQKDGQ